MLFLKERVYKFSFIKGLQVLYALTYPNVFDRNFKLITYTNNDPSFCSSIQFCNCQAANIGGFGKFLGLMKGILTYRSI